MAIKNVLLFRCIFGFPLLTTYDFIHIFQIESMNLVSFFKESTIMYLSPPHFLSPSNITPKIILYVRVPIKKDSKTPVFSSLMLEQALWNFSNQGFVVYLLCKIKKNGNRYGEIYAAL